MDGKEIKTAERNPRVNGGRGVFIIHRPAIPSDLFIDSFLHVSAVNDEIDEWGETSASSGRQDDPTSE